MGGLVVPGQHLRQTSAPTMGPSAAPTFAPTVSRTSNSIAAQISQDCQLSTEGRGVRKFQEGRGGKGGRGSLFYGSLSFSELQDNVHKIMEKLEPNPGKEKADIINQMQGASGDLLQALKDCASSECDTSQLVTTSMNFAGVFVAATDIIAPPIGEAIQFLSGIIGILFGGHQGAPSVPPITASIIQNAVREQLEEFHAKEVTDDFFIYEGVLRSKILAFGLGVDPNWTKGTTYDDKQIEYMCAVKSQIKQFVSASTDAEGYIPKIMEGYTSAVSKSGSRGLMLSKLPMKQDCTKSCPGGGTKWSQSCVADLTDTKTEFATFSSILYRFFILANQLSSIQVMIEQIYKQMNWPSFVPESFKISMKDIIDVNTYVTSNWTKVRKDCLGQLSQTCMAQK